MAGLQYPTQVSGYTQRYGQQVSKSTKEVMGGKITSVWRGDIFLEFSEELFEERLEMTLKVCVENTKQHIKDIDLRDTDRLLHSIQYWEPRREGTKLIGSYGVPLTYDGHNMDYGLYQEVGFHHVGSGQWIQNEFLINGLQRSSSQIRAIWTSGVTTTKTFTG